MINADGLLLLPGLVDGHTHFAATTGTGETRDDFAAGSAAAAAGGTTTYVNFVPQEPSQSLIEALKGEQVRAAGSSHVDYGFHLQLGTPGPDWREELRAVVDAGVTSLKVFTTFKDTISYTSDWHWLRLLAEAAKVGAIVQVHAENDEILSGSLEELVSEGKTSPRHWAESRPEMAESETVARGLFFAERTGSPIYFVHLSSRLSIDLVSAARERGFPAYAECCTHHLTLNADCYMGADPLRFIMAPPLRPERTRLALEEAVISGRVDVLGSDHVALALDERGTEEDIRGVAPGIPGAELLWPVIHTQLVAKGGMPLEQAVALVSSRPATIFGLTGKGSIRTGYDADLVLFDPEAIHRVERSGLMSRTGYSPWEGFELRGRVVRTISRGKTIFEDGVLVGSPGDGHFVPAERFSQSRVESVLKAPKVGVRG
jgi:dihydropyrimidinase